MNTASSRLFTPIDIGPVTLRNRSIRSAAFEGLCPGGHPSQDLVDYHRALAAGGVGMTTVAYVSVTDCGRTFSHQAWMNDAAMSAFRALTDAVHREGAAASVQLGHAGYMADPHVIRQKPLAPSSVFNLYGLVKPRAMSLTDIDRLVEAFGLATRRARTAGFDAVEIQAGHGYLVGQFLASHTNRRTDQYGGSFENRVRFLRRVTERVRAEAGQHMAVLAKINVSDGFPGGMPTEEAPRVAQCLEEDGVDALILSGGFVSKCPMYVMRGDIPLKDLVRSQPLLQKIGLIAFGRLIIKTYPFTPAYFLNEALPIRNAVRLPLALVGGLHSIDAIESAFAHGFDMAAMARPLIIEPDFILRLRDGRSTQSRCEPCNICMATMYNGAATCPLREAPDGSSK